MHPSAPRPSLRSWLAFERDSAVNGILASNAIAVALAWWSGEGLLVLLWPYWLQSVIIGFFAQRRLRMLKVFSVEGLKINGRPATATPGTARWTANFFVVHYGLFHLVYAAFLTTFTVAPAAQGIVPRFDDATGTFATSLLGRLQGMDLLYIAVAGLSFVWTHAQSFRANVEQDLRGRPNLGTLMFVPYIRIVPMHITIILGTVLGGGTLGLLLFGGLKTAADVVMHVIEHRLLRRTQA